MLALEIIDLLPILVHVKRGRLRNTKFLRETLQLIDVDLDEAEVLELIQLIGAIFVSEGPSTEQVGRLTGRMWQQCAWTLRCAWSKSPRRRWDTSSEHLGTRPC